MNLLRFTVDKGTYDAAAKCRQLSITFICPKTSTMLEINTKKIEQKGCTEEQGGITIQIELDKVRGLIEADKVVILTTRRETTIFQITNTTPTGSWAERAPQVDKLSN